MRATVGTLFGLLTVVLLIVLAAVHAPAQNQLTHDPVFTIVHEIKHDVSPPLREIPPAILQGGTRVIPLRRPHFTGAPSAQPQPDPVAQVPTGAPVATTSGLNFDGVSANGAVPPDTNGAAGATQFVQWVNLEFAVYNKTTGKLILGPLAGSTLWTGFGGDCEHTNNGDPIVKYDQLAGRWVMTQLAFPNEFTGPYSQCLAVSTTSDVTGTFNRYQISFGSNLNDYPKLGIWPDAYYMTFNMFMNAATFLGPQACALDRNAMLAGSPMTAVCFMLSSPFDSLLASDLDGTTLPPAGEPNFMMGAINVAPNQLNMFRFHVDFTTPSNSTFTGPITIPVAAFNEECGTQQGGPCVTQPAPGELLDSVGDRLMYRLAYRNFGDHESLVVNHSVDTGNSVGGVRWYEIRSPNSTPLVFQQGTFVHGAQNLQPVNSWMGSIAMDKAGDIAVGFSLSGTSVFPTIGYTGRAPKDKLGTLEGHKHIIVGTGAQIGGAARWGDYSSMAIDPSDDCTFWYTTEYYKTTGSGFTNWRTRIASFKFTSCH